MIDHESKIGTTMKKILLLTAMILGLTMGTHALNVSLIENSLTDNNDKKATNDLSLETGLYIGGLADFGVIKSREEFHSRPDIYAAICLWMQDLYKQQFIPAFEAFLYYLPSFRVISQVSKLIVQFPSGELSHLYF